jgi:hypothetical protein
MCCLLVSGFLTEITQQIHSLRASDVMSSHFASATGSEMRTFRKSAGTLCTAPGESAFLFMDFILHRHAISLGSPRMPSYLCRREEPNKCGSAQSRMDGKRVNQDLSITWATPRQMIELFSEDRVVFLPSLAI